MSRNVSTSSTPSGRADLTRRIAVTLALVLVADAAFVAVLASLARPWLAAVVGSLSGPGWLAAVAAATLAVAWAQLRYTRREVLAAADARPVSEAEYPDLHARVRRLAQSADATPPRLAVAETDVPNSFTVGDLRGGTVAVSTGLLDRLDGEQLDAVLAHELAHLRNRDAAVMTLATFLPALANDDYSLVRDASGAVRALALGVAAVGGYAVSTALVGAPPFSLASLLAFGGFAVVTVLFGGVALGLLALPVAVLSGRLSRDREFAADRAGAVLTGDPAALASALGELAADAPDRPTEDVRARGVRSGGVRELCLLPHGVVRDGGEERDGGGAAGNATDGGNATDDESTTDRGNATDGRGERGSASADPLAGLPVEVATHPPTEERIARLRDLAAEDRR